MSSLFSILYKQKLSIPGHSRYCFVYNNSINRFGKILHLHCRIRSNFQYCKWPKIEQSIQPSGQTVYFALAPVVDVIKLFLEEFWKIQISPQAETARIGHFKSNKQFQSKLALFSPFRFRHQNKLFPFLNFGEI